MKFLRPASILAPHALVYFEKAPILKYHKWSVVVLVGDDIDLQGKMVRELR